MCNTKLLHPVFNNLEQVIIFCRVGRDNNNGCYVNELQLLQEYNKNVDVSSEDPASRSYRKAGPSLETKSSIYTFHVVVISSHSDRLLSR